jgi:hypothetical protein
VNSAGSLGCAGVGLKPPQRDCVGMEDVDDDGGGGGTGVAGGGGGGGAGGRELGGLTTTEVFP